MRKVIYCLLFILLTSNLASAQMGSTIEDIEFLGNIVAESPSEGVYENLQYKTYSISEPNYISQSIFINSFSDRSVRYFKTEIGSKDLIYDDILVIEDYNKDVQIKFTASISAGETLLLESDLKNQVWKIDGKRVEPPIQIDITSDIQLSGEVMQTSENKPISLLTANGKIVQEMIVFTSSSKYRDAKINVLKAYTLYNNLESNEQSVFTDRYNKMITNFNQNDYDNSIDNAQQIIKGIGIPDPTIETEKIQTYLYLFIALSLILLVSTIYTWKEFKNEQKKRIKFENHPFMLIYNLFEKKLDLEKNYLDVPTQISDTDIFSSDFMNLLTKQIKEGKNIESLSSKFKKCIEKMDSKLIESNKK